MARQAHGFYFEEKIINDNSLLKEHNYNACYDAYTSCGIPIQIKFIKYKNAIDMGDMMRNLQKCNSFILIIGFWKTNRIIDSIKYHYININTYYSFIDSNKIKHLNSALKEMKYISNDKQDDIIWKIFCEKYRPLLACDILKPRFKRDHKFQKRIQCAIPNKIYSTIFLQNFSTFKSLNDVIKYIKTL